MNSRRMSNRCFRAIVIPITAFVIVLAVVATIAANLFSVALDEYLGKGEMHIQQAEGTEDWDTQYYEDLYPDNEASKEASYQLARQVQNEGSVLLKNNGVLPLAAGSEVTPFGYRYIEPIFGQVSSRGSAKWTIDPTMPEEGLADTYTLNNAAVEAMRDAGTPTALIEAPGTLSAGALNDLMGGDSKIYEFESSIYNGIEGRIGGTTALVMIARAGQEGSDKKYDGYTDGTPHYLALSQNELDTIRFAKENCDNVVVIVASSAAMELAPIMGGELEVDAILQVGHVGEKGFAALGDLLSGEVNPSGRTVDIWASDFTKDPTYQNFGAFTYNNATFTQKPYGEPSSAVGDGTYYRYFIEYEEDIYIGYRYYETADVEDDAFVYGTLDGEGAIETAGAVNYPFGYGLSYTTFEQEIVRYSDAGDSISVDVKVTNTGSVPGKEVVQLYYSAPYTEFDVRNKIEKSAVVLAAFAKTEELQPNADQTLTLTFDKEDMASYCYTRDNGDGTTGCYVLEEGDYVISLRKNSHDVIEERETTIGSTIWYDQSNIRQSEREAQSAMDDGGNILDYPAAGADASYQAAVNLFQDSSDYMNRDATILSRSDWTGTFPSMPENRTKAASSEALALFGIEDTFDPLTDPLLGSVEGSLVYDATEYPVVDSGLKLTDMRGVDYYDDAWDDFLNQVDYSDETTLNQIIAMMGGANYTTTQVDVLGLPTALHADGANGIKAVKTDEGMELSATYGYAPLMASTWNTELMYEVGNMFGKEAMENGISGWYSPAINLHRSPFGGRVFEYYSEDPLLTGKLAAAVVSGAGDAGMYCYIKHFAVNDQDTNREFMLHTWASEQAMRELYFKAFEIPFKEARMTIRYISDDQGTVSEKTMRAATACMASQNDIGAVIAHGNYALLTGLLRGEWGFVGNIHSDMYVWTGDKAMFDLAFRAGCDTFLTYSFFSGSEDTESTTAHSVMRRALHNVAYTLANSALLQGSAPGSIIYYDTSPWVYWLTAVDIVVGVFAVGMIVWMVCRGLDERKHPDKYNRREKD